MQRSTVKFLLFAFVVANVAFAIPYEVCASCGDSEQDHRKSDIFLRRLSFRLDHFWNESFGIPIQHLGITSILGKRSLTAQECPGLNSRANLASSRIGPANRDASILELHGPIFQEWFTKVKSADD